MNIISWGYREQPDLESVLKLTDLKLPIYFYDMDGLLILCAAKNKKIGAKNIDAYIGGDCVPLKDISKEMLRVK